MTISVIIPVLNAGRHIATCLEQISMQQYPLSLVDVIIADGGSTDDTVAMARTFESSNLKIRILHVGSPGRAQGLNAALRVATGEAVCRLDARSRIEPNYFELCVQTMINSGAANVGGLQVPVGDGPTQRAIALAMTHPFGVGNAQFRIAKRSGYVDTVYLGFFRREIFSRVGYFDETSAVISEDSDINFRIRRVGQKVYLNTHIRVYYHARETLFEQAALYFRYGGARAGNIIKDKTIMSFRQIIAPLFVIVLMLTCAGSLLWQISAKLFFVILFMYMIGSGWSATLLAARARAPLLVPRIMAAFGCMHFCFGLGFWRRMLAGRHEGKAWGG